MEESVKNIYIFTHMCMIESLCCTSETITLQQTLINYISIKILKCIKKLKNTLSHHSWSNHCYQYALTLVYTLFSVSFLSISQSLCLNRFGIPFSSFLFTPFLSSEGSSQTVPAGDLYELERLLEKLLHLCTSKVVFLAKFSFAFRF